MCDLKPDEPTYLFERGNEKRPDKEHPLTPGVPAALGGRWRSSRSSCRYWHDIRRCANSRSKRTWPPPLERVADCEAARTKRKPPKSPRRTGRRRDAGERASRQQRLLPPRKWQSKQIGDRSSGARRSSRSQSPRKKRSTACPRREASSNLPLAAAKAERELALCQAQEQQLCGRARTGSASEAAARPDDRRHSDGNRRGREES